MNAQGAETAAAVPPPVPGTRVRLARALITRRFYAALAVMSVALVALSSLWHESLSTAQWASLVGALLGLSVMGAWGALADDPRRFAMPLSVSGIVAVGVAGAASGLGLALPGMSFVPFMVCMVASVNPRRTGWAMAATAAAMVLVLALGHRDRLWGLQALGAGPHDLLIHTVVNLVAVGVGLAGGTVVSLVVARHLRRAQEREARFRSFLAIAADAYWEADSDFRLAALSRERDAHHAAATSHFEQMVLSLVGTLMWELPNMAKDGPAMELLKAELQSHRAFRDVRVHWRDHRGRVFHFHLSGSPRHGPAGEFLGYWGVSRDITEQVQAQQDLAATELRYQELFARIPTPIVLHSDGQIMDANPAAVTLFGFAALHDLIGQDMHRFFDASSGSRDRVRQRVRELQAMPPGRALPVVELKLAVPDGRSPVVRSTGVRVDAYGEAAVLSIIIDESERKQAEDAVRRSEALLSHLVATSPDVITLSSMDQRCFTMVNAAFERVTGYTALEVVGRGAEELGLWRDPEEYRRFIEALMQHGRTLNMPATFVSKAGTPLAMLVSGVRFTMDGREYVVINGRDISDEERARIEREAILDNASVGIAFTRNDAFVMANSRFEQMFGAPLRSMAGQPLADIWAGDRDPLAADADLAGALSRGESVELERICRRRDGSTFLARVAARAIDPSHPSKGGTIWIVEDITERRQVEEALARAYDEAEAANRAKSAFLANTSHELRTPLNGLLGLARLAEQPTLPEVRRTQYLRQIVDSAQSLAAIISDILDLSKIEAGRFEIDELAFDLGALLQGLLHHYGILAEPRGLRLTLEVEPALAQATVLGDPLRLRQILTNFVGNALKFTAAGGIRIVARRPSAERMRFEVVDTGPGVEPEVLQRLFRPFTQADQSTTRRYGGTGLGLSICRELAQLMGGEVGAHSQVGVGSTFWCELPLVMVHAATPAPVRAAPPADLHGRHVVVVEDNPVNMLICVALLEQWGITADQAGDGAQALQVIRRCLDEGRRVDAVLMDVQMPVMSGHEAARALRHEPRTAEVPVIALTAAALVSEREEAMASGMNDFLTKPIDAEKLRAALARWIIGG